MFRIVIKIRETHNGVTIDMQPDKEVKGTQQERWIASLFDIEMTRVTDNIARTASGGVGGTGENAEKLRNALKYKTIPDKGGF